MHLVIFDVDGTLVQSTGVDTRCYAQAVSGVLGTRISTSWAEYRESTDSGILRELFDRHGIPLCRRAGLEETVRQRFIRRLSDAFDSDPVCCQEVFGARALLEHLRKRPGVRIAVATGGWSASARLKLNHAGISTDGVPFASSDDAITREEILRIAHQRASEEAGLTFRSVTYVGDGIWDVRAAAALGFKFVGMACERGSERLSGAGAEVVLDDFLDKPGFLRQLHAPRSPFDLESSV